MSEAKKLWELVREMEEIEPDHTLNLIIATLLGNYGKEGRCIPGLITGEEMPKVQMLIKVCEFYHKAYQESKTLRAQLTEAQGEAFPAYKREKALRCKAEAENAELKTEIERRNSKTWCAYCGFEIDIDDEASTKISEHIMSCPKHPIRIYERHSEALEAENAALRERLKKVEEVYNENKNEENEGFNEEMKNVFWQAIKAACEA